MSLFSRFQVVPAATVAFALSVGSATLAAQPAKPKPMDRMGEGKMEMMEPATGWKELDAFHELMAGSWHPAAGKNDLAPAKAEAAEMAAAAKKWEASVAPKGCDSPKIKSAVAKVAAGSQEFAALVTKSPSDSTLKAKLGALHETFEVVEEGCKPLR